jgi:hypothetical protein
MDYVRLLLYCALFWYWKCIPGTYFDPVTGNQCRSESINIIHPKVGAILEKSVDWSDTDVILPGKSIDKASVSLQIPEVLNNKAIQVLLRKKIWIGKAIVSFQTPEFLKIKRYNYFYAKKFESTKRLYRFITHNLLAMKRYNYFYCYFLGGWRDSQI